MGISLKNLAPGVSARVQELLMRGPMRQRLYDLGLVPGTLVERVMTSPIGDPICYRVRGTLIALRCSDAEHVRVIT